MNAGAMGGETFNAVEMVRVMNFAGNISELSPPEMSVAYRSCATLKNHIALGAVFRCKPEPREEIEKRMKAYSEKRWSSQPAAPSAGCMFKNPATIPAGRLIDELGLKGAKVGGAIISQEHGNSGFCARKQKLNVGLIYTRKLKSLVKHESQIKHYCHAGWIKRRARSFAALQRGGGGGAEVARPRGERA